MADSESGERKQILRPAPEERLKIYIEHCTG